MLPKVPETKPSGARPQIANLTDILVKKGDALKQGQTIGRIYSDPDDDNRSHEAGRDACAVRKDVLSYIYRLPERATVLCCFQNCRSAYRIKLVALWIGAAGVGLFGLYNAAVELIAAVTQFNMRSTAVRDIALSSYPSRRIEFLCLFSEFEVQYRAVIVIRIGVYAPYSLSLFKRIAPSIPTCLMW